MHVCAQDNEGVETKRIDLALPDRSGSLMALFHRERAGPETLGARAGGNPNDAILLLAGQSVHFGPALTRVLEGSYCLRLSPLPQGSSLTVTVDWDRAVDGEGVASAPGFIPGMYMLEKGNRACEVDADGMAAWVIIAQRADFERLNSDWKVTSSKIAALERSGVSAPAIVTLRHAALASMADSMGTK